MRLNEALYSLIVSVGLGLFGATAFAAGDSGTADTTGPTKTKSLDNGSPTGSETGTTGATGTTDESEVGAAGERETDQMGRCMKDGRELTTATSSAECVRLGGTWSTSDEPVSDKPTEEEPMGTTPPESTPGNMDDSSPTTDDTTIP